MKATTKKIIPDAFFIASISAGLVGGTLLSKGVDSKQQVAKHNQAAALKEALKDVKEQAYFDQLNAGTISVTAKDGQTYTLKCAAQPDGSESCQGGLKFSKDQFQQVVRSQAAAQVEKDFSDAYAK